MKLSFDLSTGEDKPKKENYDVAIIGAGPAGCSAAIYARRYMLDTLVISRDFGGLIADADIVDNYPGLPEILGSKIADKFVEHAKKYEAEFFSASVEKIERTDGGFKIFYDGENFVFSKTLILATGEKHRKLDVPREKELSGRGVSYCAVCDAPLYKDKVVAVVGGGNTAFSDVQLLAKYASKVYLIHRRNWFRADPIEIEKVKSNEKIEILTPYIVSEIKGKKSVEGIVLKKTEEVDGKVKVIEEEKILNVDGIFVDIGLIPNTDLARSIGIELDSRGYIIVDDEMKTNVEGVYAAGDCTNKGAKLRQVVLAAAQGAIAATSAYNYIRKNK